MIPAESIQTVERLVALDRRALLEALKAGEPVHEAELAGHAWLGVSLGLPGWVERLAWKTFAKTFHRTADGGLRGWNIRIQQHPGTPLAEQAFTPETDRHGAPVTFGHYRVCGPEVAPWPRACPPIEGSLLLDYGAGGNGALDPLNRVRDPLVSIGTGVLLGWSYALIGRRAVGTPAWFCLVKGPALDHVAEPPRPAAHPHAS